MQAGERELVSVIQPRRVKGGGLSVAILFLASGAVAVLAAVSQVAWFAVTGEPGRLHKLTYLLWTARLSKRAGFDLLGSLPAIADLRFDLVSPASLVGFLALALATSLLWAWGLAALLTPAAWAVGRICLPASGNGSPSRFWPRAYAIAVSVGFAVPAILGAVWTGAWGEPRDVRVGVTIAAVCGLWCLFLGLFGQPERIRRFAGICAVSGAGCVVLAFAVGTAAMMIGPDVRRHAQPPASPGLPNVLLISIDSLRRDHVHCYGYPRQTSPTIDKAAREGVRFETAVSPTSWTLPAHLTLLTSLPPEQHGVIEIDKRLGDDTTSLAQVLWRVGYATAGFVSGPLMHAEYGFARGFDHYDDYTVARSSHWASHQGVTSPRLVQLVRDWLEAWHAQGRSRPFFVFLHMWDVHYDYTPPPPYDTMFDPDYRGTISVENYRRNTQIHKHMDPRDLEHVIALYDGEIRFTDLHIGRLLDFLTGLGVLDDTITVITADHGDEFFEHGNKGHRRALYDETIVVPLVIRFPKKVPAGKVVRRQVRLADVAPTVLALAGLDPPADYGTAKPKGPHAERDLTPFLGADAADPFPELVAFGDLHGTLASIRTDAFKLIANDTGFELYDLAADPGERRDLAGRSAVEKTLAHALAQWRQEARQEMRQAQRTELSWSQKERLRSLGYLE